MEAPVSHKVHNILLKPLEIHSSCVAISGQFKTLLRTEQTISEVEGKEKDEEEEVERKDKKKVQDYSKFIVRVWQSQANLDDF